MTDIIIRSARPVDELAVIRLAALDSRPVPAGDVLVAEVDGKMVAAVGDRGAVADPFRRTDDVVELLRVRAASLRALTAPALPPRRRTLTRPRLA